MTNRRHQTVALFLAAAISSGTASAQAPASKPEAPPDSTGLLARRVVAETMMGLGFASAGFVLGPSVASAACNKCIYAAGFAGASAAFPFGVYWGGSLVRGRGSFWLTAAGSWAVSASAFTALALDEDYDGQPALAIASVGGAIAAPLGIVLYEVTHADASDGSVPENRAGSALHFVLGPRPGGLAVVAARSF